MSKKITYSVLNMFILSLDLTRLFVLFELNYIVEFVVLNYLFEILLILIKLILGFINYSDPPRA